MQEALFKCATGSVREMEGCRAGFWWDEEKGPREDRMEARG